MSIFQVESLAFHIFKAALYIPAFSIGFKNGLWILSVRANHDKFIFEPFGNNHQIIFCDHMVECPLFPNSQVLKKVFQWPFTVTPLD